MSKKTKQNKDHQSDVKINSVNTFKSLLDDQKTYYSLEIYPSSMYDRTQVIKLVNHEKSEPKTRTKVRPLSLPNPLTQAQNPDLLDFLSGDSTNLSKFSSGPPKSGLLSQMKNINTDIVDLENILVGYQSNVNKPTTTTTKTTMNPNEGPLVAISTKK